MTRRTGTREWADSNVNVSSGCSHDCLYCYAKAMAIRFGRKTPATWATEVISPPKSYRKHKGLVMLPTTHDITEGTIDAVIACARGLLATGNELLVVSKPRLALIRRLLLNIRDAEWDARALVTLRFTVGSGNDATLSFWEPGAPRIMERLASLVFAFHDGWRTSVSMEPMLDHREHMVGLVETVAPFVTDTIWLGTMRHARARLAHNGVCFADVRERLEQLERCQSDDEIRALHGALKDHPKVRWKESIAQALGLDAEEVG